jgi:hypothetical protein
MGNCIFKSKEIRDNSSSIERIFTDLDGMKFDIYRLSRGIEKDKRETDRLLKRMHARNSNFDSKHNLLLKRMNDSETDIFKTIPL